jgi:hypothetical protein
MSAGGTTAAGNVASVMAPLGKMITRRKKRKDKNPSIYGGPPEENVLFAEGSARPEYHNTQVKGSDATPKAKPGRTKHPFKGKLVGASAFSEGDMEADREAGIKWVDNPDWKKLHDMDFKMVKDFFNHKENVPEAVGDSAKSLYDLQDELGLEDNILVDELARYLDVDQIADFVETFRRHHEMKTDDDKAFDAEFKAADDRIKRDAVGDDTTLTPFKYSNKKESIRTERKLSGDEKKRKNIT